MSALPSRPPKRIVVKLGTGVLTSGVGQLDADRIAVLCRQFAALHGQGVELLVVSSGAIALGMGILGLAKRPQEMARKQACAAIGQNRLMETWKAGFAPHGITVAQALLTHEDLRGRDRHLGVKETLRQIVAYGAVPIINENDTVSSAEIKFGENDTLSALVASLVGADYLFILSTAPGLIDLKGTGEIVPWVEKITPRIEAMAGGTTSETAVGGMISKISAAKIAVRAGCGVFIASGSEPNVVPRLLSGEAPGTFFAPAGLPLEAKKRWLAFFQRPTGTIRIDARAVTILREKGGSLLPVGVTRAEGQFEAGEVVNIAGPDGEVVARGTSGYASSEVGAIAGKHSEELRALYPGRRRLEAVHRDGLVLL
ncbi:MAG TPA: glutamate 5-kinase [Opitutaceae bacterium]|nr:glutamate 5-kinase [Opitutaceae bacterium]